MTDIVEDLRGLQSGAAWVCGETAATLEDAADEIERLRLALTELNTEVCQRLGKPLGYPWFRDDQQNFPGATEENGVCTGEHVAESIAAEAARRIGNLEAERDEAIQRGDDWCDQAKKLRAERDRLRAGLLRALQYENKCDQTGQLCDASDRCACSLEAETWCGGGGA
jgi:hypothetical protein